MPNHVPLSDVKAFEAANPKGQAMWKFEYQDEKGNWHQSAVEYRELTAAVDSAAAFMETCQVNGYRVAVRICPPNK